MVKEGTLGGRRDFARAPADHARHLGGIAPFGQGNQQFGKCAVSFADHRIVNAGDRAHQLRPHLTVEVGAAEDRDEIGEPFLQPPRQSEGRRILLEGAGEADHTEPFPGNFAEQTIQVIRNLFMTQHTQALAGQAVLFQMLPILGADPFQQPVIRVRRLVAEGRCGKEPLAQALRRHFAQRPILRQADSGGKVQVQMKCGCRKTMLCRQRFQQSQLH